MTFSLSYFLTLKNKTYTENKNTLQWTLWPSIWQLTKCFKRKKRKWDNTGGIHVQDKLATSRLYSEIWGRRVSGMGYLCNVIISLIPSVNYMLLSLTHARNNSLVLSVYYFYSLTFYYFDLLYTFPPRAYCSP